MILSSSTYVLGGDPLVRCARPVTGGRLRTLREIVMAWLSSLPSIDQITSLTLSFFQVAWAWLAVLDLAIVLAAIPWILSLKRDSTAALAWSLVVILLPLAGFALFLLFGYTHVHRPLRRKRKHHRQFAQRNPAGARGASAGALARRTDETPLGRHEEFADRLGALPARAGNRLTIYDDGAAATEAMLGAIATAQQHVHLEFYIVQPDATGRRLLELLERKAREGVEVRLLYDAVGSRPLGRWRLRKLRAAGGRTQAFLELNPLRRRLQLNMRNHRKLLVVDGRLGFMGGLNIGDEYMGLHRTFGHWRDTQLRVEGPAVADLQRVFVEDWDFASDEDVQGEQYFPDLAEVGPSVIQIVDSGPDQQLNRNRELIFAAIVSARERVWIASPYLVPDPGLLDAVRTAARMGVDVRLMCPAKSDHLLTHFAGRYYWSDLLDAGVSLWEYTRGMMHAKSMLVDDDWGWIGSANFDHRSLSLNFELNCVIYDHVPPRFRRLAPHQTRAIRQTFVRTTPGRKRLSTDLAGALGHEAVHASRPSPSPAGRRQG
jgi:cardiolipin synthase A/B